MDLFEIMVAIVFAAGGTLFFITTYLWNKNPVNNRLPLGWWLVAIGLVQFMAFLPIAILCCPRIGAMKLIYIPSACVFVAAFVFWCISLIKHDMENP